MATKLVKGVYPTGHRQDDFKCFGPIATKDADFVGTKMTDLGCFNQGEVDSNKYYHASIVQSKIDSKWYVYFCYGRTGDNNPQFQWYVCTSEADAQTIYEKQLHSKNDKRGTWVDHPTLGRLLQPKVGKDMYVVRPQTVRTTGLPDARNIGVINHTVKTAKTSKFDPETTKLLKDLSIGTTSYARASMAGSAIPTFDAITEGRLVLDEAQKIVNKLNDDSRIMDSEELEDLTKLLYSRIPKYKGKSADRSDWLLTATNIGAWRQDLDAFEGAITSQDTTSFGSENFSFNLSWLSNKSEVGGFIHNWFKSATRNRHGNVGEVRLKGVWQVDKDAELHQFKKFSGLVVKNSEKPLHQPQNRLDISDSSWYNMLNVAMLFHGTRSVNVSGILNASLRMPKTLSNVVITGSCFGSGLYFADDFKKSIGYTSHRGSYWTGGSGGINSRGAFMFICDVILGNVYVAPRSQAYQNAPSGFHSVMGKMGTSGVMNNEFIIYNTTQQRLRYLLEVE